MAEVGGDGRDQCHAHLGGQLQLLKQATHVTGQRALADHYAFGLAGGAGGMNHVGRRIGWQLDIGTAGRQALPQRRRPGQALTTRNVQRCFTPVAFGTQQHLGLGIAQHLLQACIGGFDVQWHVHATGLEDRQHRRQPVQRALHQHRDRLAFADTQSDQVMSQLIGRLIQLTCAQGTIQTAGGQRIGLAFDLPVPELQYLRCGLTNFARQLHRQRAKAEQWHIRCIEQGLEQVEQFGDEALDGRTPIQVAGVGHVTVNQRAVVGNVQCQIEMRTLLFKRIFADLQPCQLEGGFLFEDHVLVELGLEQRVVPQVALRREVIDQLLEWHVLMRLRAERGVANLRQQIEVTQALVYLAAQHLSVDEETNQPFGFRAATVGVGHADADIALPGLARQKQRKTGQHQHEQAHALGAGEGIELVRQLSAEVEAQVLALKALRDRAREVLRGVQQRLLVTQLAAPVIQLTLALARLQPAALPDGVVGVLQRQRRQTRFATFDIRLIAVDKLLNHHVHRPAVGDDVVHVHHQHMLVAGEAEQVRTQQRARAQVERLTGERGHLQRQFSVTQFAIGQNRQVNAVQRDALVVQQHLQRLIAIGLEHCAQYFVAFDQVIERTP
ncbi:Peptide synthase PvdJ [Pseudomonas syringae pv. maculicola]|nr:Peptide synthase PvdJ [Pseudomonas syringae pv. maculicola]